jgi:hypothetical protein
LHCIHAPTPFPAASPSQWYQPSPLGQDLFSDFLQSLFWYAWSPYTSWATKF